MKKIVLLRHGESAWNKENRFTGWTDVDLTEKGVAEALKAGELLAEKGFRFQKAYTSYLKRAVKTLNCVLDRLNQDWIPVEKSWRLNEKHYGQLQGLNKAETAAKYGDEQVLVWRRSYDIAPHALAEDDPRNPRFEERYREVPDGELPRTESLKDTIDRIMPYWKCVIFPSLKTADELLVVAHGNSLRGIIKHLKHLSDEEIVHLNLPTAVPYVFEFDDELNLTNDYFLGDPEEIRKLMEGRFESDVSGYTQTTEGAAELLNIAWQKLQKQETPASLQIIVVNSPEIMKQIGTDKAMVDLYRQISMAFKSAKGCFLLTDVENAMISFSAGELLKQVRDTKSFIIFENIKNIKVTDISMGVARTFKKELDVNDAYVIQGDKIERVRVVQKG